MQIVVFENEQSFIKYRVVVAKHTYNDGRDRWDCRSHLVDENAGWPRAAIEEYDNANHTVELWFIDPLEVLEAAANIRHAQSLPENK